ncbi:MAG: nucleotidyltransferase [Flavobacteriales bacterium]|nr:nucleotidyltransferase [Flavobacteriales bacterium]
MKNNWEDKIDSFIELSNKYNVRMIMVGGGAVNFHGYQRHSADVDFWIDTSEDNMNNLVRVFQDLGYEIKDFPDEVKAQKQNISVKFSPIDLDLELITKFSVNKTFNEAYNEAEEQIIKGSRVLKWKVLSFDDLITSKIKSGRYKDLLDVQQLKELKDKSKNKGMSM